MRRPSEAAFKKKAAALFLDVNPGATVGEWTFFSTGFNWADGSKGVSGRFVASAPGFRTREVFASWMSGAWSVR